MQEVLVQEVLVQEVLMQQNKRAERFSHSSALVQALRACSHTGIADCKITCGSGK